MTKLTLKEFLSHRQMDEEFEKAAKEVERVYAENAGLKGQVQALESLKNEIDYELDKANARLAVLESAIVECHKLLSQISKSERKDRYTAGALAARLRAL